MTGPMGPGRMDQPTKPKPPEKPPDKPAAGPDDKPQVPPDVHKQAEKQPPPDVKGGQGSKGNDDHQGATPQGGKAADVKPADPGPRPSGDQPGKQAGDAGQRRPDGPARPADNGPRPGVDVPPQVGEHPGTRASYDMATWKADFQNHWQVRPDGHPQPGPADAKGGQRGDQRGDQRGERYSHRVNLDDCRGANGKFDRDKLKAKLEGFAQADRLSHTKDLMRQSGMGNRDAHGHQAGPEHRVGSGPLQVSVRFEHARSYVDVREVNKVMHEVCDKYRINGRIEIPGRPPVDIRPGPVIRPEAKPGGRPGPVQVEVHRPDEGVRPPGGRFIPTPQQPRQGWHNIPPGR